MLDKIIIILPKEANVEPKRMISLLKWFQKWVSPNIKKISLDKSDLTIHAKNLLEENARLNEEIGELKKKIIWYKSMANTIYGATHNTPDYVKELKEQRDKLFMLVSAYRKIHSLEASIFKPMSDFNIDGGKHD